jgi:uncharacterized protein YukE
LLHSNGRKDVTVPDVLRVDHVELKRHRDAVFAAMQAASGDFCSHEDELAEAAPGWRGASQQALADVAASWETRHTRHQSRLTELNRKLADAAERYVSTDGDSAQDIEAVQRLAREMGI